MEFQALVVVAMQEAVQELAPLLQPAQASQHTSLKRPVLLKLHRVSPGQLSSERMSSAMILVIRLRDGQSG